MPTTWCHPAITLNARGVARWIATTGPSTYSSTVAVTYTSTGTNGRWVNASSDGTSLTYHQPSAATTHFPLSPEGIAAWEAERTERLVAEDQRRIARAHATDRANATLREFLTSDQWTSFERDRAFQVVGSAGGLYRIRYGTAGNVEWWEPGSPSEVAGVLCAHPDMWDGVDWLPTPDVMLAQMLALTTDEPGFVRTANVHRGRRPTHIPA